jgi:UDP-2-acetamido-2-deoxy-ribo-hexuluronate aminotransferase
MGHIGCTSFFPSKNLGCYGDGGALFTNDADLFQKIKMIANHGQAVKYHHEMVGVNSRLDTMQASILDVKLKRLDDYARARNEVAIFYDKAFKGLDWIQTPARQHNSTHVFHQYTLKLTEPADRDKLKAHLEAQKVPAMVYYPIALHLQNAFKTPEYGVGDFPISETLCSQVISLPMHTEMTTEQLECITGALLSFKSAAVLS